MQKRQVHVAVRIALLVVLATACFYFYRERSAGPDVSTVPLSPNSVATLSPPAAAIPPGVLLDAEDQTLLERGAGQCRGRGPGRLRSDQRRAEPRRSGLRLLK